MTKCHRLGSLNNRDLFSYSSGGWKPETRGLAYLVWGEFSSWLADKPHIHTHMERGRKEREKE